MSTPETPRQYPITCPLCEEVKGYPYQVRTVSGPQESIEVKLRCRQCQHEWVEIVESRS
jgi:DNA-directed RNA polymerase subunit M/transcription elongation factor TFIIS